MTKICVTSPRSVGCTFVEWSIHFLSGKSKYYNILSKSWIDLSADPIRQTNAHGHKKNHPFGLKNTKLYIEQFNNLDQDELYSFYPSLIRSYVAAQELGITIDQFHDESTFKKLFQYIIDDYNKIFHCCGENNVKIVFVHNDPRAILYHQESRSFERFLSKPGKPKSQEDLDNEYQDLFFKDSQDAWNKMNLADPWDIRERLALDMRPFEVTNNFKIAYQGPHLWINCLDLWTQTIAVIKKIMAYLELDIDPSRLESWLPVCQRWQQIQLTLLDFCFNQPHIVDAIVNNLDYKINLTFKQEAIIQHCLIYQHGLNLKTWQLEKFPNNTKDLHRLLEPNIHQVPKIY